MADITTRINEIDRRLAELPAGTLTYKTIHGKKQPYLQRTVNGKSVSYYIKTGEREQILLELEERSRLHEEREHLQAYLAKLEEILQGNPLMKEKVGIGYQRFDEIRENQLFYVDKTRFIKEWWESAAQVSLISRPRRFGKTLMMSTVDCFFSPLHQNHPEYFSPLYIWKEESYRQMYGTIPVIFISFGGAKGGNYKSAMYSIIGELYECWSMYGFLKDSEALSEEKKKKCNQVLDILSEETCTDLEAVARTAATSVKWLSECIFLHYQKKPIILLDEYDTPLTEAYVSGYFQEMIDFCRSFFHETFKDNRYFSRAIITGVTKVSKNSLFCDLNNIAVYTCTGDAFADSFGFTQQEVMDALQCQDIDELEKVKEMYDGFIFGKTRNIYNPWSICCYMAERNFASYWINTSANDLIGNLIRKNSVRLKKDIELLMQGGWIHKQINENAALQYLGEDEEAFWALLLSAGYIKADHAVKTMEYTDCDISITNKETMSMFESQILRMFPSGRDACTDFADALLAHRVDDLNMILNELAFTSVSYFDTGRGRAGQAPENFYHGLVMGLTVLLKDRYMIQSNRESGFGRYDIALIPRDREQDDAFLMEFKVFDERKEKSLEETADRALAQIEEKEYEKALLEEGIPEDRIYRLGLGFRGKEAFVKEEK